MCSRDRPSRPSPEPGTPFERLRLTGPTDLVLAVPFLVGFHPVGSLVGVAVDDADLVVLTVRVDLPSPSRPPQAAQLSALATPLAAAAVRAGATKVLLLLYPEEPLPARLPGAGWPRVAGRLVSELSRQAGGSALEVSEVLLVARGRFWSLMCLDTGCCPRSGVELPEPASSRVAAEAVAVGLVARAARSDLEADLAPVAPAELARVEAEMRRLRSCGVDGPVAVREIDEVLASSDTPPWSAELVGRLLVALSDVVVRDAALSGPSRGTAGARDFWIGLLRRSPPSSVPTVATLLAATAYRRGEGALASMALERALLVEPDHRLAGMLQSALGRGVPPDIVSGVIDTGATEARAAVLGISQPLPEVEP
jgi:hypothetical protein